MIPKLKEIVHNNIHFDYYRAGIFYYTVTIGNEDWPAGVETFRFPIPQDDIGDATMLKIDKGILYMRWIRKAIEDKIFIKV